MANRTFNIPKSKGKCFKTVDAIGVAARYFVYKLYDATRRDQVQWVPLKGIDESQVTIERAVGIQLGSPSTAARRLSTPSEAALTDRGDGDWREWGDDNRWDQAAVSCRSLTRNRSVAASSHALPDIPGKKVTVVRVTYGPGGFTPPHRHAGTVTAYITKGQIRSQLKGGPVEIFDVGQSFFEPPGAIHLVSANASNSDWAELIAIFVADEGAQLTTLIEP